MIKVSSNFRDLSALIPEHDQRYLPAKARNTPRAGMAAEARARAAECGLSIRDAVGASRLVTDDGSVLDRRALYALAPVGSEKEAARAIVEHLLWVSGQGNWYVIGRQPVDYAGEDGLIPCGDIDGVTHVLIRSYYYHDPVHVEHVLGARQANK